MSFTTTKEVLEEDPVGPGGVGTTRVFFVPLEQDVEYTLQFGTKKLADVDHVMVEFPAVTTNGSAETIGGAPNSTPVIAADGKSMTLEHNAAKKCVVKITGKWVSR